MKQEKNILKIKSMKSSMRLTLLKKVKIEERKTKMVIGFNSHE